jgi:hypothetical protein
MNEHEVPLIDMLHVGIASFDRLLTVAAESPIKYRRDCR